MITSSLRAEKFEVVKERYAMETRKIVRGIILAVLLVCTVFLIYSIDECFFIVIAGAAIGCAIALVIQVIFNLFRKE